jgi:hypothetical protein
MNSIKVAYFATACKKVRAIKIRNLPSDDKSFVPTPALLFTAAPAPKHRLARQTFASRFFPEDLGTGVLDGPPLTTRA